MRLYFCRLPFVAALVMATGSAFAAPPTVTGLGEAWPNAADHSASPGFHVYTFDRDGIRYVQVNDANGTVRGAIAVAGQTVLDLPVGVDASRWVFSTDARNTPRGSTLVYRDASVSVLAVPQRDGSMQLMSAPGQCDNPAQCSIKHW